MVTQAEQGWLAFNHTRKIEQPVPTLWIRPAAGTSIASPAQVYVYPG
jgi:hypothetical protein